MDLVPRQRPVIPWNSTLYADDPTGTSFTGALFVGISEINCGLAGAAVLD